MSGSRRLLVGLVAVAVVGAAATAIVMRVKSRPQPGPLACTSEDCSALGYSLPVHTGDIVVWSDVRVDNPTSSTAVIESVVPTDITPGLSIVGIRAIGLDEAGVILSLHTTPPTFPRGAQPVRGFEVAPGDRGTTLILIALRAAETGTYLLHGLTVTYHIGGQRYQDNEDYTLKLCYVDDPTPLGTPCRAVT